MAKGLEVVCASWIPLPRIPRSGEHNTLSIPLNMTTGALAVTFAGSGSAGASGLASTGSLGGGSAAVGRSMKTGADFSQVGTAGVKVTLSQAARKAANELGRLAERPQGALPASPRITPSPQTDSGGSVAATPSDSQVWVHDASGLNKLDELVSAMLLVMLLALMTKGKKE